MLNKYYQCKQECSSSLKSDAYLKCLLFNLEKEKKVLKGAEEDIVENQYIKVWVIAKEPDGRSQKFARKGSMDFVLIYFQ